MLCCMSVRPKEEEKQRAAARARGAAVACVRRTARNMMWGTGSGEGKVLLLGEEGKVYGDGGGGGSMWLADDGRTTAVVKMEALFGSN
jgi:hypothetical protein